MIVFYKVHSVHTVSPLQTQIAGHGSENDGQRFFVKFLHEYKVVRLIMSFLGDSLSMSLALC